MARGVKGSGSAAATARAFAKETAETVPQSQRSLLSRESVVGSQK